MVNANGILPFCLLLISSLIVLVVLYVGFKSELDSDLFPSWPGFKSEFDDTF